MLNPDSASRTRYTFASSIAANTGRPVARQGMTVRNLTINYSGLFIGNDHHRNRIIKPYTHQELAMRYGVSWRTQQRWLKPFQRMPGEKKRTLLDHPAGEDHLQLYRVAAVKRED